MQLALRRALAAGQRHAQVEDAPVAVVAQVQVAGLDVAVHHALAVQPAERACRSATAASTTCATLGPAPASQHLLQRAAAMPVEHGVERAGIGAALVHAHEAAARRARRTRRPSQASCASMARSSGSLARDGCSVLSATSARRAGIARLVEPVHAGVGHQRGDDVAVEHVAHLQRGGGAQAARVAAARRAAARVQAQHANHQRGGVVALPAASAACDQRIAGLLRAAPASASSATRAGFSTPCTPSVVSTKQSPTRSVALHVVDPHVVVQADGARQAAAQVGMVEAHGRRVSGVAAPSPVAHAPGARVAHVGQRVALAVQHQRGERGHARRRRRRRRLWSASQAFCAAIRRSSATRRLPGVGRGEVVAQQAHHRGLRRLAARGRRTRRRRRSPRSGRAIPRRAAHAPRRRSPRCCVARPALAAVADVDLEAHGARLSYASHGTQFA